MFFHFLLARRLGLVLVLIAALAGLAAQLAVSTTSFRAMGGGLADAFWRITLYFTVLTNGLVAAVCAASLIDEDGRSFFSRASTQGAAALSIAVVGIVYSLLLRALWNPQGLQFTADLLLHDVTPSLYVLCWLFFMRKGELRWGHALWWLAYPLAYLIYALTRGATEGLYPYPFIDIAALGGWIVARNSLLMLALFLGLGFVVLAIDRVIGGRAAALR